MLAAATSRTCLCPQTVPRFGRAGLRRQRCLHIVAVGACYSVESIGSTSARRLDIQATTASIEPSGPLKRMAMDSDASSLTAPSPMQLLRLPSVVARTGLARSTIYKLMAAHTFPTPVKISARAVAWRSSDIEQWTRSLRDTPH